MRVSGQVPKDLRHAALHFSGMPLAQPGIECKMGRLVAETALAGGNEDGGSMVRDGNKFLSMGEALALIKPGARIMVGGFGLAGYPEGLVEALAASGVGDLTIISNDLGSPGVGLGKLLTNGQIKALIGNYYNWNPEVAEAYHAGRIEVTLIPQGTFAEAIRAAGVGIPAFYTAASAGTDLAVGKETRAFDGRMCVLERAIPADVALIRAYRADEMGNLVYYKTARNFNPLMAMAAAVTIAEVDEIVPVGELDPESIVTPHIFVQVIIRRNQHGGPDNR